jgi:hypothetical protein
MCLFRKKKPFVQSAHEVWRAQWQSLFPPECRNVPVTVGGVTHEAYVLVGHNAMMLQDGLLMEATFFDVCELFQRAGYHVVWLMRCTQDIRNGYLVRKRVENGGKRMQWLWKRPTTNFGRWSSDQKHATILLQIEELPEEGPVCCEKKILQRVIWAESSDAESMVPKRTTFTTVNVPDTPPELVRWLNGESLSKFQN